jgi:hypothetical protein
MDHAPGGANRRKETTMDAKFDELAAELAKGLGRRDALRRIGTALAGVLLASIGLPSQAQRPFPNRCGDLCNSAGCRGQGSRLCLDACVTCFRSGGFFTAGKSCSGFTCL